MTPSLSCLILFTTNASLTLLSIYWAATAWASFRTAQTEPPWIHTNCTVLSKELKNRSISYCPEITVANFTTPPQPKQAAYRHGFQIFNESLDSAKEFLSAYDNQSKYSCWLSPTSETHISFNPVPYGPRPEDINLAAISTVLAIAAVLSLAAISYLLCISPPPIMFAELLQPPMTAARPGLSHEHIDAVIAAAEDKHAACEQRSDDLTCAICLEDGLGARLPCNHAFHPVCIRSWLARGGETCPLCCTTICAPDDALDDNPVFPLLALAPRPDGRGDDRVSTDGPAVGSPVGDSPVGEIAQPDSRALHHIPTARRTFVRLPSGLLAASRRQNAAVASTASPTARARVGSGGMASDDGLDSDVLDVCEGGPRCESLHAGVVTVESEEEEEEDGGRRA